MIYATLNKMICEFIVVVLVNCGKMKCNSRNVH